MKFADKAMYSAKQKDNDRYELYEISENNESYFTKI